MQLSWDNVNNIKALKTTYTTVRWFIYLKIILEVP